MGSSESRIFVRLASLLALASAVGLGVVLPYLALHGMFDRAHLLELVGLGAIGVMLLAIAAGLNGLASLLTPQPEPQQGQMVALAAIQESLEKLRRAVDHLSIPAPSELSHHIDPPAPPPVVAPPAPLVNVTEEMQGIVLMLQEIKELSLLSDAQRLQRLESVKKRRQDAVIQEIKLLLDRGQWSDAAKAIDAFDREFPHAADSQVLHARLNSQRQDAEGRELVELREQIEDLMAIASWEQAETMAAKFAENHPANDDGRQLLARVQREHANWLESTANRLYDEIKTDIEHRHWRRALQNAQKLLERSPGHRRSKMIRAQINTIRENAEIEERQEQERTIQELVRNKRFAEAIDLAEDLLERFPMSPQAESLQRLLPKMRELAIENEIESET